MDGPCRERGPRFDVPAKEAAAALEQFFFAATQDLEAALKMRAPDALPLSDGGGKVSAALRPLRGPADIMQVLTAIMERQRNMPGLSFGMVMANAAPALARYQNGAIETVTTLLTNSDGKISWIYMMRNPDKLAEPAGRPVSK